MRKLFIILFIALFSLKLSAQEFKCVVSVSSAQVQGTDKRIYENMQTAITEFMNDRTWTNRVYGIDERLECSILITVSERISTDVFKGRMNLVLRRPVFNTSYNTTLVNYVDKDFQFEYVEQQNLEFSESTHSSNLTSVLGFFYEQGQTPQLRDFSALREG